jgi:hypothetical protein
MRPKTLLIATFSDADTLVAAVHEARKSNLRIYDVFAPYPIHGLDEAMGIRRSRLPWVTLLGGLAGLTIAFALQFYANVLDWPLNVGGKPDNSTLAFIPIAFELTVLLAGLGSVAALFFRARLYPGRKESLVAEGVTNDTFALVVRSNEYSEGRQIRELLGQSGTHVVDERAVQL